MIWEQVLHMLNRKALLGILLLLMLLLVSGCGKTKDMKISSDNVVTADFENSTETEEANVDTEEINIETTEFDSEVTESADYEERNSEMKLYVNDTEIPVIWEDNSSVTELMEEAGQGEIIVSMSMYSNNEQVGSLGRSYTRNDKQTTTHNGDIVLYSGSNIVLFYGSNSWAYTRFGKIDLPEDQVTELLSNGDVVVRIRTS